MAPRPDRPPDPSRASVSDGPGGSALLEEPVVKPRLILTSPLKVCTICCGGHLPRLPAVPALILGFSLAVGGGAVVAATRIPQAPSAPTWRVVDLASPAPRTGVQTLDPVPAPRTSLIPAAAALPQRLTSPRDRVGEEALPADAQVAAARIRPPYLIRPSLSGGVPTGFVGGWGDYFLSGSAGTAGNLRGGSPDGSLNLGFGLGDPERFLGAELFWGIGSIKNLNSNGAFGATIGRLLVNRADLQVSIAGGVIEAFPYGFEPNPQPANGYGALTVAMPLRPSDPSFPQLVQFSVGGGGSTFAAIDSTFQSAENGVFGAAGVELSPNLGVSVGVSTRSTNLNLSWIPLRTLPIFVNVLAADVFSATPWGTIGVLSVGWGDSLKTGLVTR